MCRGVMAVASTTVGVMEDQGYCRWNTTMKSLAQGAKNHVKSAQQKANSNKKKMPQQSASASSVIANKLRDEIDDIEHFKKAEESLRTVIVKMSKSWMVAASVGAVEALKDQLGVCRWNFVMRNAQQQLKNHVRSMSQAKTTLSSSSSALVSTKLKDNKGEESLRTVMYLSCWGPN
ncbi:hypothetical protein Ahy_B08g093596 isoform B [Arachis hypogaea]|uniref:Wound-responsive family protein n=1 Tax=Arachis hypogaea TaxID=3818 RepID=A0A444Y6E8_ARAHY|nr:hypothetical protein Ahy_B08g093596 isoform B [Arachis hypogaea]